MKNTKRVLLSLLAAVMLFGCFGVAETQPLGSVKA